MASRYAPPPFDADTRTWAEAVPLGDVPLRGAALWGDSEAIVFPGTRWTYPELAEQAERTARSLLALGVRPGDHVAVLMSNSPDFVRCLFGSAMIGAVAVLINARYQGRDLTHVLADSGAKVLLSGEQPGQPFSMRERIESALADLDPTDPQGLPTASVPQLRRIVMLGELPGEVPPVHTTADAFDALAETVDSADVHLLRRRVSLRSIAAMMYTSGTTSAPKGCLLSHEMVVRNGIAVGERLDVRRGDRFWDPLPMFHMSSVLPMIASFYVGGTFISMQHFEADAALTLMHEERVTHAFPTFPTVTQALAQHPRFAEVDFGELRLVNNVAPPARLRELQKLWPHATLVTAYGSTETGGCVSFSEITDSLEDRTNTCGRPFPGIELCVVDRATGGTLPLGERGEICVRGYSMFEGYHGDPSLTTDKTDDDGWFHTGDIGSLDKAGRVSYHGRLKDMLKVGGENVAAVEIEELLQSHPAVSIAQVVGVPDPRLVEVPAAFLELAPGHSVTDREIWEWLQGRVATFKVPHHLRFVEEWPVAATKIQKFRLREQLCAELGLAESDEV
ncbi:class I adenylate-forming enzyme family protein [Streptomyces carpinensis]|uniref:AMP-binding protein n=1 Tax=Streptomyces carpinensis TaxID=66369 RepID=A0ABV1W0N0_9ACTN|nr:AMP-binding protein [Streptomyces carpinensis]